MNLVPLLMISFRITDGAPEPKAEPEAEAEAESNPDSDAASDAEAQYFGMPPMMGYGGPRMMGGGSFMGSAPILGGSPVLGGSNNCGLVNDCCGMADKGCCVGKEEFFSERRREFQGYC
jgi:hypothetical protein